MVEKSNPLSMSDEDFLNLTAPPESSASAEDTAVSDDKGQKEEDTSGTAEIAEGDKAGEEEGKDGAEGGSEEGDGTEGAGADEAVGEGSADANKDKEDKDKGGEGEGTGETGADTTGSKEGDKPADKAGEKPEDKGDKKDEKTGEQAAPNYQAFYEQIMKPFKANGKTVELKTPEEAITLMQMGANYTRRMQEIVPHRKALTMLQNNGLLDEEKLSFLIDLDKGDKEAVKKFIKDKGIDPLDIDTSVEPAYVDGNHKVTDSEVRFRDALDELSSNPNGTETLKEIDSRWDQASKDLLWDKPETLKIIQDQRDLGIYDRIAAEIDRRTTLGSIPATMPFLQAYKIVGDDLTANGGFADLIEKHKLGKASTGSAEVAPQKEDPKVVTTRAAAPKSPVANDDKASAAASTRTTPAKAKEFVNPLAMSDDEFLKKFEGRL